MEPYKEITMSDAVTNENPQKSAHTTDNITQMTWEAIDLESLSEFERARITSKTWSMGQD